MYRKRHRTTFSQQQLDVLEEAFKQNIYPSPSLREAIALRTNLDSSRVQVWFQNRRAKHKRQVSQVNQVIRNFTSSADANLSVVVPPTTAAAAAAALEAALVGGAGEDFCLSDHQIPIVADSCVAHELSACYDEAYETMNQFAISQQTNNQQLPQQQQQQQQHHHQQQQQADSEQLQQQQQRQQSQQQQQQQQQQQLQQQDQYYNYYRQQIGQSLKTSMTEFLQS